MEKIQKELRLLQEKYILALSNDESKDVIDAIVSEVNAKTIELRREAHLLLRGAKSFTEATALTPKGDKLKAYLKRDTNTNLSGDE